MPTMYELTVPALVRGLNVLDAYMDRAMLFAVDQKIPADTLIHARLAPDMMTLCGQVQRASDHAKNGVSRLAAVDAPSYPDNESTFPELKERLAKTIGFIKRAPQQSFDDGEKREIKLPFKTAFDPLTGASYLSNFLLPNFYFHVATAHAILRHLGLDVGKMDYLGLP